MTRSVLGIVSALLLASCGQKHVQPITQIVKVPTPAPCVPADFDPKAPVYPDTDDLLAQAADAAERYLRLWTGRDLRAAREAELNVAVAACPQVSK